MPQGPGKYDEILTEAREKAEAFGAILIVLGGNKGNGFSVQARKDITGDLPVILREIANEIEKCAQVPDQSNVRRGGMADGPSN